MYKSQRTRSDSADIIWCPKNRFLILREALQKYPEEIVLQLCERNNAIFGNKVDMLVVIFVEALFLLSIMIVLIVW